LYKEAAGGTLEGRDLCRAFWVFQLGVGYHGWKTFGIEASSNWKQIEEPLPARLRGTTCEPNTLIAALPEGPVTGPFSVGTLGHTAAPRKTSNLGIDRCGMPDGPASTDPMGGDLDGASDRDRNHRGVLDRLWLRDQQSDPAVEGAAHRSNADPITLA
jgi:hypothetical protein